MTRALCGVLVFGLACLPTEPVEGCRQSTDCGSGSYCARSVGACDAPGECAPRPEICAQIYAPVCGCEGNSHSNLCRAASAGASVRHVGDCR